MSLPKRKTLSFRKETLRNLSNRESKPIVGGATISTSETIVLSTVVETIGCAIITVLSVATVISSAGTFGYTLSEAFCPTDKCTPYNSLPLAIFPPRVISPGPDCYEA